MKLSIPGRIGRLPRIDLPSNLWALGSSRPASGRHRSRSGGVVCYHRAVATRPRWAPFCQMAQEARRGETRASAKRVRGSLMRESKKHPFLSTPHCTPQDERKLGPMQRLRCDVMGCEVDPSAPPACLVGVELQALVLEIRQANHCRKDAPVLAPSSSSSLCARGDPYLLQRFYM